jgi:hypothetical protein
LEFLIVGFVFYFFIKDKVFEPSPSSELFTTENTEAFGSVLPPPQLRKFVQAPIYPSRVVMPSGPNPPSQEAPEGETVV